ncbi:sensor histidine kinase [Saccharothrix tamanrassetensis]|uniref:sensor histidine kinase n=1 Tax=Saccharothrix tamanrassetensis TaxID=1051531 RepID=UPI00160E9ECA|nr:HAMP domain-containing sensor histidine kinase [Saccharothrix tamanrassetensis]
MRRRGPGLRVRLTLLATGLVAFVSALLLLLGWMLVGRVVASSPRFPDGSTVRVDGVEVDAGVLADTLGQQARDDVLRSGSIAFLCVVAAAALLAWTVTGRVLQPVHDVTDAARKLSAESLGERLRLAGPRDEVAELADTFDEMLDRLQAAFDSQRRFVANASHELRTPLSVIRTELDVTLTDPDADEAELRRMASVVRAATERAEQLVSALLLLARTDGLGLAVREPVDLNAVVESAWNAVRNEAAERQVRASFVTGPAPAVGDPALLERIAGNLLENAVRHNLPGGWIEVRTEGGPEWTSLRVSSSGPVIAPDRVDELFEPFRRGGTDRTARTGTGLGLSIVRAAVAAHEGRVHATAIPGGGLSVVVALPSSPH